MRTYHVCPYYMRAKYMCIHVLLNIYNLGVCVCLSIKCVCAYIICHHHIGAKYIFIRIYCYTYIALVFMCVISSSVCEQFIYVNITSVQSTCVYICIAIYIRP